MSRKKLIEDVAHVSDLLEQSKVYIESEAHKNPGDVNAVIFIAAVNDGEETQMTGAITGDTASLATAFIHAFKKSPALIDIVFAAYGEVQREKNDTPCTCSNCTAERGAAKQNTNS